MIKEVKHELLEKNETLPRAVGSEEPVSEFLFEKFLFCDLQNQMNPITIARNASAPIAPPTIVTVFGIFSIEH